jgi:UDP-N-acetylmuramoyl-tripeptide--D-alanyl-D-alanine ligase
MNENHKAVVVEMGMRGVGQIAHLAKVAEPTIAVITKIAENHIELLGSIEAIADAKGELIESLKSDGTAILNRDDPYFERLSAKAKCAVLSYGYHQGSDLKVIASERKESGHIVKIQFKEMTGIINIPSPSEHDVSNAMAAALVALTLGVSIDDISASLSGFAAGSMRMEVLTTSTGGTILSDCYNASPTSMKSALETIASYPAVGRKVAFLGDMRELGEFAPAMHKSVSEHADKLGVQIVYAVGPIASEHYDIAQKSFPTSDEAAAWAKSNVQLSTGDVALVKGSRAIQMEKIVEALTHPA